MCGQIRSLFITDKKVQPCFIMSLSKVDDNTLIGVIPTGK